MTDAVKYVGGGGRRGEELLQEVVAARFEDDLVVHVGYVHHLSRRHDGEREDVGWDYHKDVVAEVVFHHTAQQVEG